YGLGILIFQFGRSIYQAEERFNVYIKIAWIKDIIIFIAVLLLYFSPIINFYTLSFSISFINIIFGIVLILIIFRDFSLLSLKNEIGRAKNILGEFVNSTLWLMLYFFMLSLFQRLDIFMLSHFSSEKELANYGVAFRYYTMGLLILNAIHVVLLPKFSKVDYQDTKKQTDFIHRWLKFTSWLIIPILITNIVGKPAFLFINGEQYERAFYIFVIFSIGIWFSLMFSPLVNVLMSRKEFKFLFLLAIGALIINFCGNYLLIQILGALGASIITVVSVGFINIYCFLYLIFFNK
ncbi:oligosaccharide flippase family protein, partial [Persephonella sp.]